MNQRKKLLPLIVMGLGVLAVGAALFFALQPGSNGAPKLSVDKQEVNFGDVKLGENVTAAFTVTNTGSAPLRFTKAPYIEIKAGC